MRKKRGRPFVAVGPINTPNEIDQLGSLTARSAYEVRR